MRAAPKAAFGTAAGEVEATPLEAGGVTPATSGSGDAGASPDGTAGALKSGRAAGGMVALVLGVAGWEGPAAGRAPAARATGAPPVPGEGPGLAAARPW